MAKRYIQAYTTYEGGRWQQPMHAIQVPNTKTLRALRTPEAKVCAQITLQDIKENKIRLHSFKTISCTKRAPPIVIWDVINGWRNYPKRKERTQAIGDIAKIAQLHNWDIRSIKGIRTTLKKLASTYNYVFTDEIERVLGNIERKIILHRSEKIEQERQRYSQTQQRLANSGSLAGPTSTDGLDKTS